MVKVIGFYKKNDKVRPITEPEDKRDGRVTGQTKSSSWKDSSS